MSSHSTGRTPAGAFATRKRQRSDGRPGWGRSITPKAPAESSAVPRRSGAPSRAEGAHPPRRTRTVALRHDGDRSRRCGIVSLHGRHERASRRRRGAQAEAKIQPINFSSWDRDSATRFLRARHASRKRHPRQNLQRKPWDCAKKDATLWRADVSGCFGFKIESSDLIHAQRELQVHVQMVASVRP